VRNRIQWVGFASAIVRHTLQDERASMLFPHVYKLLEGNPANSMDGPVARL
jgi:hypothetical protein